jgi:hypothetical protein
VLGEVEDCRFGEGFIGEELRSGSVGEELLVAEDLVGGGDELLDQSGVVVLRCWGCVAGGEGKGGQAGFEDVGMHCCSEIDSA